MPALVLASTSPYRRQLLARLQVAFDVAAPEVDEAHLAGEPPDARALRLAEEKAQAAAADHPAALLLGGDQTIAAGADIFDKPHTAQNAAAQLCRMSGRPLTLYTAVALFDSAAGALASRLVTHRARCRCFSADEARRYVEKEDAANCAGGVQIEGLGIALMQDIQGGDPTALMGMPLIVVAELLRAHGVAVP